MRASALARPSRLQPLPAQLGQKCLCRAEFLLETPISRPAGVSAGREELPRGAVHLLQLPRVRRADAPVEAPVSRYQARGCLVGGRGQGGPSPPKDPHPMAPFWGWVGRWEGEAQREGACPRSQATVTMSWSLSLLEWVPGCPGPVAQGQQLAQTCCGGGSAPPHKEAEAGTRGAQAAPDPQYLSLFLPLRCWASPLRPAPCPLQA